MKIPFLMDFVVDKDKNEITITRAFAASLSSVWAAFTQSEMLDKWWAPRPWKARTKTMDFREGGQWHYAMVSPEGEEHWALIKYLSIRVQKGFTALDGFSNPEGTINPEMPQSAWDTYFQAGEANTTVVFKITFNDLAQLETTIEMGFKEGFTMALEGLDEVFAGQ